MVFIPRWERYRTRKPTGAVEVDWGNALTLGLHTFVIAPISESVNLVDQSPLTQTHGNVKAGYIQGGAYPALEDTYGEVSIGDKLRFSINKTTSSGAFRRACIYDANVIWNGVYDSNQPQGFLFGTGSRLENGQRWVVRPASATTADNGKLRVEATAGFKLFDTPNMRNKRHIGAIIQNGSNISDARGFIDGVEYGQHSVTAIELNTTATTPILFGDSPYDADKGFGGTNQTGSEFVFLMYFERGLTGTFDTEEIIALSEAPYQILKPRVTYFDFGAVTGNILSGILSVGSSQLSASAFKQLFSQSTLAIGNSSVNGDSDKTIKASSDNSSGSSSLSGSAVRDLSLDGELSSSGPIIDGQLNTNIIATGDAISALASILGVSTRLLYQSGVIATGSSAIDGTFFKEVSANSDISVDASGIAGLIGKLLAFSGALATDQAAIDGQSTKLHSSSGDLSGLSATIDGALLKIVQSIGWLVDGDSTIDASAIKINDLSGALASGNSDIFGTSAPIKFMNGALAYDSSAIAGALAKVIQANGSALSLSSAVNGAFAKLIVAQGDQASSNAAIDGQARRIIYVESSASTNNSDIFGTSSGIRLISGSLQTDQAAIIGQFVKQITSSAALTSDSAQITSSLQTSSVMSGQLAASQPALDGQIDKIVSAIADAVVSESLIDGESVTLRILLASGDTVTVDVTMQGQAVKTQQVLGDPATNAAIIQGRLFIGGHEVFFSVVNIIASDSEHTILVSY